MNKVNINACASILSKDHKVRDKFIKAMEGSMSMDDAEFKSELCSDLDLKHAFEQRISKCRSWLTTSEHVLNKKQVIDEILTKHLGNDSEKIKKMYKKDVTPLIAAIVNAETKKFNRHIQDDKDDLNYYITLYNSIKFNLPIENFKQSWFLDSTEGPNRMRKRIVREVEISHKASDIPIDSSLKEMEAEYTGLDEENYELLLSEQQQDDVDTLQEDKNRKILRSLFIGDKIVQILNVTQILGLETCESALIIGISHLYLAGYYFHTSMGEIVDIDDAPEDERDPYVKVISGNDKQKEGEKTTHTHETKTWEISNLLSISKRNFLLRDVALEFFFVDGTSFLITCLNKSIRDSLFSQLSSKITAKYTDEDLAEALKLASQQAASHKSGAVSSTSPFGAKLFSAIVSSASTSNLVYSSLTKKWRRGELSNFYYLILLNTLAGRTFNDLTQYPVFPFVIADYESDELDLENPATFRDLSKPMGAQTLKRANQFKERFQASAEMSPDTPPFHYGTHYSSAMIVTSYLIRLKPFVKSYLLLQGGKFDHADRTFYSIAKTWYSASRDHTTDVRELIPEFYYLPEFLVNSNNFEFGNLQDGNKVSDVILPPWAKGDPLIFVSKMRQALESDYVSKHLHEWIDLVFGFKQRGEKAIESLNLFHHLSYHGSTDLDKIKDQHEKSVIVSVIHNFGQTPLQIFNTAHPEKQNFDKLKFDSSKLLNLPLSVIETNIQIDHIEFDYEKNEWIPFDRFNRVLSNGVNKNISVQIVSNRNLIVNGVLFEDFNKCKITKVEILTNKLFLVGFQDGTIQVLKIQTDRLSELKNSQRSYLSQSQWPLKLVTNVENIKNSNHDVMVSSTIQSPISPSPASFSMFTSSSSSSSMMTPFDLVKQSIFRGHSSSIISIKHALKYKSVLTLSSNGDVKLWDLLTGTLIRDIDNDCKLISISKNLGLIVTVKNVKNMISVFTINGYSIIKHDYDYDYADDITTIEFSEFSEIGDCSGGGGGGLELSSLKISKNLNIPWCNYANLAIGTNEGSMKLYELKLSKSWELIELRKFDQVTVGVSDPVSTESSKSNNNSNDVKITSIKFNLSVELNGNGNRIGRGELIVGDSSGRLMIWR
ncbi:hypothetical protein CANARDRAFT_174748 [[Candida] arabinofermentans NRRL YB-2248]|uniref:BEACH domain-containing protein n=1 Tax=[Candida] arabinofermentans NRRL YB-2248 TaxID=983967 RepID=A0A1E4T4N4_9ASCO|nr:hypothetical protein CANARDRAFT_174748 [[Candida] arabinofermentans NRRL YB-2248]